MASQTSTPTEPQNKRTHPNKFARPSTSNLLRPSHVLLDDVELVIHTVFATASSLPSSALPSAHLRSFHAKREGCLRLVRQRMLVGALSASRASTSSCTPTPTRATFRARFGVFLVRNVLHERSRVFENFVTIFPFFTYIAMHSYVLLKSLIGRLPTRRRIGKPQQCYSPTPTYVKAGIASTQTELEN